MINFRLALAALMALVSAAAFAQNENLRENRLTATDLVEPTIFSFPEDGNIILMAGAPPKQIYFKESIKAIRLNDELLVKTIPITDHIIAFTGLAPGKTDVVVETAAGQEARIAIVTVVRELHEVKIYKFQGSGGGISGNNVTIVNSTIAPQTSREPSDYVSVLCNEIGCVMPRAPK